MKPRKQTGYGDSKQVREGGGHTSFYQVATEGFFSKVNFKLRPQIVQDTSPRSPHWQACLPGCPDIFSIRKQAGKGTHGRDWVQLNEHPACLAGTLHTSRLERKKLHLNRLLTQSVKPSTPTAAGQTTSLGDTQEKCIPLIHTSWWCLSDWQGSKPLQCISWVSYSSVPGKKDVYNYVTHSLRPTVCNLLCNFPFVTYLSQQVYKNTLKPILPPSVGFF